MNDLSLTLFIIFLVSLALVPFVLIPAGIIRRHKNNGPTLYMIGAVLLSLYLSALVSITVDAIFNISNLKIIAWIVLVPMLFGSYRLFKHITERYGEKSKYISYCRSLIRCSESVSLPSCEDILLAIIEKNLSKTAEKTIPHPSKQAAETAVYRLCLNLVDSNQFRTFNGLTQQGRQLLCICRYCLVYFLEVGYITKQEYTEHSEHLNECESHNDHYIWGIP